MCSDLGRFVPPLLLLQDFLGVRRLHSHERRRRGAELVLTSYVVPLEEPPFLGAHESAAGRAGDEGLNEWVWDMLTAGVWPEGLPASGKDQVDSSARLLKKIYLWICRIFLGGVETVAKLASYLA